MTNKPTSFYDIADRFGHWFGEPKLERIDYVPRPRSIDMTQFTEQELRWMQSDSDYKAVE